MFAMPLQIEESIRKPDPRREEEIADDTDDLHIQIPGGNYWIAPVSDLEDETEELPSLLDNPEDFLETDDGEEDEYD
jgi:hypothetical protein